MRSQLAFQNCPSVTAHSVCVTALSAATNGCPFVSNYEIPLAPVNIRDCKVPHPAPCPTSDSADSH